MKTLFDISVSSAAGIEAVTKRELKSLGITDAPAVNGRINFKGDLNKVAECNLRLRTANRVYIVLACFKAEDFDALYGGVYDIEWGDILPCDAKIVVEGKCVSSKLMAVSACCSVSKKAICNRLSDRYRRPIEESGERYKIEISVYKNTVTVFLDTSGDGLHRRGYRGLVGEAPLKETLASALIYLSGWNASMPLADVFCGSGTFPIEAAQIALGIPPGANRDFDFLHWKNFDFSFFGEMKAEALAGADLTKELNISGFDIDERQIRLAMKHAELAGVRDRIHLQRADMREFSTKKREGVFICNPPYGERLSERRAVTELYRDFGKMCARFPDWTCCVLTSVPDFEKWFGKRADKKRKIYNGKLECNFYTFFKKADKL